MSNLTIKDGLADFILYTTPNRDIKIETYLHNETIWLTQKVIAELFWGDIDQAKSKPYKKSLSF